jgi:hypothetical protein
LRNVLLLLLPATGLLLVLLLPLPACPDALSLLLLLLPRRSLGVCCSLSLVAPVPS